LRRLAFGVATIAAATLALAAPAHADQDTDFQKTLHTFGIYGPKDYNAWIGKITCKRLHTRLDADAEKSAQFVAANLQRGTTTGQAWQFLGAAINTYCPDQIGVLQRIAAKG
jgi:hypothetical protein